MTVSDPCDMLTLAPVVHLELHTHDLAAASWFYFELLRWESERLESRWGNYHACSSPVAWTAASYVVSSTLENPGWHNSTVLKGQVVDELSRLKCELDGNVVVYGSGQLVQTLIEHDLVDELRLLVYPIVLGAGQRLSVRPATRSHCAPSTSGSSVATSPISSTSASSMASCTTREGCSAR
jgi:hypothetical protein